VTWRHSVRVHPAGLCILLGELNKALTFPTNQGLGAEDKVEQSLANDPGADEIGPQGCLVAIGKLKRRWAAMLRSVMPLIKAAGGADSPWRTGGMSVIAASEDHPDLAAATRFPTAQGIRDFFGQRRLSSRKMAIEGGEMVPFFV
jgi:hypothetical protein